MHVEIEDPRDHAEDVDVLPLVLRRATDRLDGAGRDGHGDVGEAVVVRRGFDVVAVVDEHAAGPERADMGVVAVLIKHDQHVGAVAGGKDIARSHAHLKDRRPARDRGRDRHVGHDVLVTATGEPGEETSDGLNAILGVTREADDNVVN